MTGKVKFSGIPLFGRGKSNLGYIEYRSSKLQFVNAAREHLDQGSIMRYSEQHNEIFLVIFDAPHY